MTQLPQDVASTFLASLAGWLTPSVFGLSRAPTRDGFTPAQQADAIRGLGVQSGPQSDPRLEQARAYSLIDTAVRGWITEAFRHERLEDRYTAVLAAVTDEETCHAATVGARNAQGVAE